MMKPLWYQPISWHARTWNVPNRSNPRQKQKTTYSAITSPFTHAPYEALKTNSDGNNVMLIRRVLQQATDHYPRLSALGFTLQYANCHSCDNEQHDRAQLLRFHAETYCRISDYSKKRIEVGKSSQPTLLRWLWEDQNTPTCLMMLLFNLAICTHPRHDSSSDDGIQEVMM